MKKKLVLAVILSMLAVTSTGCGIVLELIESFDSIVSNTADIADEKDNDKDKANDDKYNNKESKKDKESLSDIFSFDDDIDKENPTEDITEATEAITENITEATTEVTPAEIEKSTELATNPENIEAGEFATDGNSIADDSNVLYDEAGLKITYLNFEEKYGYFRVNMSFENSSDVPFEVQAWDVYINGQDVSAVMSVATEVDNTIDGSMKFSLEKLRELGIQTSDIETIEVSFHIFDWEDKIDSINTPIIKFNI